MKKSVLIAGTCAMALVLGWMGASFALNRYLQGESFQRLLNAQTAALFHAEGEYLPIQRNGFSFYSDGYSARGTGLLRTLQAAQIRAEFEPATLFHGAWHIRSLQIQSAKAGISLTENPEASPSSPQKTPSWIPQRFVLSRARIEEAALEWTGGSLSGMRLILEPNGRDLVVTGYNGILSQSGWPVLSVDHVNLRCRHPEIFLTDSLFQIGDGETLTVSGQLDAERRLDLQILFRGIGITPYLPKDWRASLHGKANGEARVTNAGVSGSLSLSDSRVEALPVLDTIAAFTRTRQFRQFALQKAEVEFAWENGLLTVRRLEAKSENLIQLTGSFTMRDGVVQGEFMLGVEPSTLRWLPGSRERVFTDERDGYAWTTLRVSGSVNRLEEDLSARLTTAAGEEVIDQAKKTIESGAKSLFDLLKPSGP